MLRFRLTLIAITLLFLGTGCASEYQKVLKSTDFELKYTKAQEYYNKGDYYRAIPLFEELMPLYKGQSSKIEKLYYYYAYCHYGQKDYLMASFYFKNFVDYYPRSVYAEDAQFMMGYCYYKMSPRTSLDQNYSQKAIESLQLFANAYPYSDKLERVNQLIDQMRLKMEAKAFESAELYYRMRSYKAAGIAFKNLLQQYPDTPRAEEIGFLILRSNFLLAEKSIETKQEERYSNTLAEYYAFIDKYPTSKYGRDAERIYDASRNMLQKLKDQ